MPAFTLYKNVDFKHGVTLPTGTYTHTDPLEVFEGGAVVTWDMLADWNDYSGFQATAAADINPSLTSVTLTLEASTNSGADYSDVTTDTSATADIIPADDITLGTANAVTDLEITIQLADGTISADVLSTGTSRFRLKAVISND